ISTHYINPFHFYLHFFLVNHFFYYSSLFIFYLFFFFLLLRRPLRSPLFPYTTLFRSAGAQHCFPWVPRAARPSRYAATFFLPAVDRKSTRLNSSHVAISYAVFCLKKKKKIRITIIGRQNKENHIMNIVQ